MNKISTANFFFSIFITLNLVKFSRRRNRKGSPSHPSNLGDGCLPMDEEGRLLTGAPGYTLVHRGDLLQISISGMRASYLHALGAPLGWPRQVHPR